MERYSCNLYNCANNKCEYFPDLSTEEDVLDIFLSYNLQE